MKILVTGGAGFIGSHIVDLYLQRGHDVVVIDNLSTGNIKNIHSAARFYQLDIRSPDVIALFMEEKPDVVSHHAAHVNVRQSLEDPIYDGDVNILGSLNLLEAAVKAKVKQFIYASSGGAVYGEPEYLPCDELHSIHPISPYGASKYIVEIHLEMYSANYGLDYTILRYPNIYGPRQDPGGEAGVISIFGELMLTGRQVEIFGDGEQVRDFLYVTDCARANLYSLKLRGTNEIFNLGTGRGISVNEIYSQLSGITKNEVVPLHSPEKVGETRRIYLDPSKAYRLLRWRPIVPLEVGLKHTVEYIKDSMMETSLQVGPSIEPEVVEREQRRVFLPRKYDLERDRTRKSSGPGFNAISDGSSTAT